MKKAKQKLLVAALTGMTLCTGCDLLISPGDRLARAEVHIAAGDYGEASVDLRKLLDKTPGNLDVLIALARLNLRTGDLNSAWSALERASASGSDSAGAATLRARLLLLRGQAQQLLEEVEGGKLDLPSTDKALLRAQALQALGRMQEAREAYVATIADAPGSPQATIGLAEVQFASGDRAGARRRLEEFTSRNGGSAEAWLALGILLQRAGDSDEAEQAWQKALPYAKGQLSVPQHAGLIVSLANFRLAASDIEGTERLLAELVKVAPQGLLTRLLEGRLQIASGKAADAVRTLRTLVQDAPTTPSPRVALASALLAQGDVEQALQTLEKLPQGVERQTLEAPVQAAARAAPDSSGRWQAIGAAQIAMEQPAAARQALQRAVEKDPASVQAASALVTLDLRSGKFELAGRGAATLAERFPADPLPAVLLGDANLAQKQYEQAGAAYAEAWKRRPEPSTALAIHRARKLGGFGDPLEPLEQALALNPQEVGIRAVYAQVLMVAGRAPEATREYERVLRDAPSDIVAMNNLALLYQQMEDGRAVAMAERAYKAAPGSAAVADTLGWILLQRGRTVEALARLRDAHGAAPESRTIRYHYAEALARTGDKSQARNLLTQLLADGESFEEKAAAMLLLGKL